MIKLPFDVAAALLLSVIMLVVFGTVSVLSAYVCE